MKPLSLSEYRAAMARAVAEWNKQHARPVVPPRPEPRMIVWTLELCTFTNAELHAWYALPSPR